MCTKMHTYSIPTSWPLLNTIYLLVPEVGLGGVARNPGPTPHAPDVPPHTLLHPGQMVVLGHADTRPGVGLIIVYGSYG